jgi:transposase
MPGGIGPCHPGASTRSRPGARFRRLAGRFGKGHENKAAIAVARALICIAWAVMARGQDDADAGEDYDDQRDQRYREHLIRHHQQAPGPARLPGHPHPAR